MKNLIHHDHKLSLRNKLAFMFSLVSFVFLIPGVYLSMLSITIKGPLKTKLPEIEYNIFGWPKVSGEKIHQFSLNVLDTTRSILKTIEDLWDRDYIFVAIMIFLFSVIVPVVKGILLMYMFFSKNANVRQKIFKFIKSIGKWSMCDVFIVAVFLAYLSTGAAGARNAEDVVIMGYAIHVDVVLKMHAHLQLGFWCFLAYCLISLLALQLYEEY